MSETKELLGNIYENNGPSGLLLDRWQYNPDHSPTPGWGQVTTNADPGVSDTVALNLMSSNGKNYLGILKLLDVGSSIYIQNSENVDSWIRYNLTEPFTFTSDAGTASVVVADNGTAPATGWGYVDILFSTSNVDPENNP